MAAEQKNRKKIGETRFLQEFRAVGENDVMVLEGYAVIYDVPATHDCGNGYRFTEVIQRGALDNCDMSDVPLKYNHNNNTLILARTRNGSLELVKDDRGLKIKATLIDTTSNRDLYKSVQAGLIDKMSFSFTVAEHGDVWSYGDDSTSRTVININKLYDVSLVDVPFYDATSVYARTLELLESSRPGELESIEFRKRQKISILKLMED